MSQKKSRARLLAGLVALTMLPGLSGFAGASEQTYYFGLSDQRTNITFQSETDFETVLGSSHELRGSAVADFDSGEASVELEVPVASLRTGIDLRDEHLRSPMWLDAESHGTISFVSKNAKKAGRNRWKVEGTFTMHGVSREISTVVDVREIPSDLAAKAGLEAGDWIRITAPFEIKLSDFGVKVPEMAAAKVDDTWEVRVQAYASTAGSPKAMNPCNPCGDKMGVKASNPVNPCG